VAVCTPMPTRPDQPTRPTGYFGMHAAGATRVPVTSTPLPPREILIGGVRWQLSAEEYHAPAAVSTRRRPGPRGLVLAITCVRFATGRLARVTYVTQAASDVLTWSDRDLTALFDVTIPAPAA
jgi:hypothetical protein